MHVHLVFLTKYRREVFTKAILEDMRAIFLSVCTDFEAKGTFRITAQGNSGFYFRSNPPADNPDGFPKGYEAQICNSQDAYTGWLWKPGKPTGKATELLVKDGEWFGYRIKAVAEHIEFWINDKLVMTYDDAEYK